MAHWAQQQFFMWVKSLHAKHFNDTNVLDVGSLDINGNNRYLFSQGSYLGLDILEGKNVDIICPIHLYQTNIQYDTIINSEMLEHDIHHKTSMQKMYELVKPGGLLLITCAGPQRAEHGTTRTSPQDSPATNDYYMNLEMRHFYDAFDAQNFSEYFIKDTGLDMQFYGIKR